MCLIHLRLLSFASLKSLHTEAHFSIPLLLLICPHKFHVSVSLLLLCPMLSISPLHLFCWYAPLHSTSLFHLLCCASIHSTFCLLMPLVGNLVTHVASNISWFVLFSTHNVLYILLKDHIYKELGTFLFFFNITMKKMLYYSKIWRTIYFTSIKPQPELTYFWQALIRSRE